MEFIYALTIFGALATLWIYLTPGKNHKTGDH